MAEINVTQLVDVMLVLLIIFMITAPLLTAGVPIELPDSRANALDQDPKQVTISIDREGYIFIDKERVEIGGFPDALAQLDRGGGEPPQVTLRADKALDYGRVMAVMGELNRSGFNSISLVTNGSVSAP
jgi:biopolymer transport protein TolR